MPYIILSATDYEEWVLPHDSQEYTDIYEAETVARNKSKDEVIGIWQLSLQELGGSLIMLTDKNWQPPIVIYVNGHKYIPFEK